MQSDESSPDDDLRTRLHAMETRLRRMRDQRASHNESARRAADSRNSVQDQGKELRSSIEEKLNEQKEVRARAKAHQNQRDAIQSRIREIISNKRGKKGDEGKAKTGVVALSETIAKISSIENRIMTDGSLTLKAENRILRELKSLMRARKEERERVIRDHNQSVKDALKTPDQDEELADSLTEQLLSQGSLTLGGSMSGDAQGSPSAIGEKSSTRKRLRKPKSFRGRGK